MLSGVKKLKRLSNLANVRVLGKCRKLMFGIPSYHSVYLKIDALFMTNPPPSSGETGPRDCFYACGHTCPMPGTPSCLCFHTFCIIQMHLKAHFFCITSLHPSQALWSVCISLMVLSLIYMNVCTSSSEARWEKEHTVFVCHQ